MAQVQEAQVIREPVWLYEGSLHSGLQDLDFPNALGDLGIVNAAEWESVTKFMVEAEAYFIIDGGMPTVELSRKYCETVLTIEQVLRKAIDEYEPDLVYVGACLPEFLMKEAREAGWEGSAPGSMLISKDDIELFRVDAQRRKGLSQQSDIKSS